MDANRHRRHIRRNVETVKVERFTEFLSLYSMYCFFVCRFVANLLSVFVTLLSSSLAKNGVQFQLQPFASEFAQSKSREPFLAGIMCSVSVPFVLFRQASKVCAFVFIWRRSWSGLAIDDRKRADSCSNHRERPSGKVLVLVLGLSRPAGFCLLCK